MTRVTREMKNFWHFKVLSLRKSEGQRDNVENVVAEGRMKITVDMKTLDEECSID